MKAADLELDSQEKTIDDLKNKILQMSGTESHDSAIQDNDISNLSDDLRYTPLTFADSFFSDNFFSFNNPNYENENFSESMFKLSQKVEICDIEDINFGDSPEEVLNSQTFVRNLILKTDIPSIPNTLLFNIIDNKIETATDCLDKNIENINTYLELDDNLNKTKLKNVDLTDLQNEIPIILDNKSSISYSATSQNIESLDTNSYKDNVIEKPDSNMSEADDEFSIKSQNIPRDLSNDSNQDNVSITDEKVLEMSKDKIKPENLKKRNVPSTPKGPFYFHDTRNELDISVNITEHNISQGSLKENDNNENKILKTKTDNKWTHDLYDEYEQRAKDAEEIICVYGYNIREKNGKTLNSRLPRDMTRPNHDISKDRKSHFKVSHNNRDDFLKKSRYQVRHSSPSNKRAIKPLMDISNQHDKNYPKQEKIGSSYTKMKESEKLKNRSSDDFNDASSNNQQRFYNNKPFTKPDLVQPPKKYSQMREKTNQSKESPMNSSIVRKNNLDNRSKENNSNEYLEQHSKKYSEMTEKINHPKESSKNTSSTNFSNLGNQPRSSYPYDKDTDKLWFKSRNSDRDDQRRSNSKGPLDRYNRTNHDNTKRNYRMNDSGYKSYPSFRSYGEKENSLNKSVEKVVLTKDHNDKKPPEINNDFYDRQDYSHRSGPNKNNYYRDGRYDMEHKSNNNRSDSYNINYEKSRNISSKAYTKSRIQQYSEDTNDMKQNNNEAGSNIRNTPRKSYPNSPINQSKWDDNDLAFKQKNPISRFINDINHNDSQKYHNNSRFDDANNSPKYPNNLRFNDANNSQKYSNSSKFNNANNSHHYPSHERQATLTKSKNSNSNSIIDNNHQKQQSSHIQYSESNYAPNSITYSLSHNKNDYSRNNNSYKNNILYNKPNLSQKVFTSQNFHSNNTVSNTYHNSISSKSYFLNKSVNASKFMETRNTYLTTTAKSNLNYLHLKSNPIMNNCSNNGGDLLNLLYFNSTLNNHHNYFDFGNQLKPYSHNPGFNLPHIDSHIPNQFNHNQFPFLSPLPQTNIQSQMNSLPFNFHHILPQSHTQYLYNQSIPRMNKDMNNTGVLDNSIPNFGTTTFNLNEELLQPNAMPPDINHDPSSSFYYDIYNNNIMNSYNNVDSFPISSVSPHLNINMFPTFPNQHNNLFTNPNLFDNPNLGLFESLYNLSSVNTHISETAYNNGDVVNHIGGNNKHYIPELYDKSENSLKNNKYQGENDYNKPNNQTLQNFKDVKRPTYKHGMAYFNNLQKDGKTNKVTGKTSLENK
ncbi:homeobox protein 2-like isoform X3 [Gordionus sp. m RMFG-2023]|uniref:homeobox protein 2-like isoform X3 n=1 Tax=Gordionus sp. m RMFG-2023 TaxID=3053472 RepID=UPI0031FCCC03